MGRVYRAAFAMIAATLMAPADNYPRVATPSSHAKKSNAQKPFHKDLPNFEEATTTLYRGGQPTKEGFRRLQKMGVNMVVDLRGDRKSERKLVNRLGMQYVPMHWECSFPKDETFARFLLLIRNNPGKKIFVHCRLGDDRTGMMIASYRMAEQSWSAERAEKEMEKFGFDFTHRRLICPGLSSYEEHFPHRYATSPAFRALR